MEQEECGVRSNSAKQLTEREKIFCTVYAATGDVDQASGAAGYRGKSSWRGERLLAREDIAQEVNRLSAKRHRLLARKAEQGYERLAFGGVADAVELLYLEKPQPGQLQKMDLFAVSEIRKLKDGAMEIKFFDRMQALEKLQHVCEEDQKQFSPLLSALQKGAEALGTQQASQDAGFTV